MALQDVDMGELKHGPQDLRPMPAGMYEKRFPGLDGDGFDWDNVLQERWYGPGTGRGRITEFSAKAKNRMKQRFGTLDWKPLFPDDGRLPALMTLTMPGERWAECAPTPRDFAKMWQLFNLRFREAWGEPLVGGWKLEFQRRGAPHIHVIMLPPTGLSKGRPHADWKNVARHKRHQLQWRQGEDGRELVSRNAGGLAFEQWLSLAWAKLVAVDKLEGLSPEGRTSHWLFHRHVGAGTNVSSSTIQRYADPRRIASYFDKHGVYKAKDYQNQMCEEWRSAVLSGEGGMRFWGWWGLTVTTVEVELDERPRKFMTSRKLEFGPVPGAVDGRGIIGD